MVKKAKKRTIGSIKRILLEKSKEAALGAVQLFNNPNMHFKAESYVVLMIIAWTYLMHAYYRDKHIEYRYFNQQGKRRKFSRTRHGAYKYWELEKCLNYEKSPIDKDVKNNLIFLIGLRHEIEHQMTSRIDDLLSARFQACALNYNTYIKELFGEQYSIDQYLSFSLQFSSISKDQKDLLEDHDDLPKNIKGYIEGFDCQLSDQEYASEKYAYRVLFVPKFANNRGQADRVIEFVPHNSAMANQINKDYVVIKEAEKNKYLPKQIVEEMHLEGFVGFKMYDHTQLWKAERAKSAGKAYGVNVAGKWYWYDRWLEFVRKHCQKNQHLYC